MNPTVMCLSGHWDEPHCTLILLRIPGIIEETQCTCTCNVVIMRKEFTEACSPSLPESTFLVTGSNPTAKRFYFHTMYLGIYDVLESRLAHLGVDLVVSSVRELWTKGVV